MLIGDNSSGIRPKGHRILILPEQVQETTESGIILHTTAQKEREAMAQNYGKVVAMGSNCYMDQPEPWCAVGNRVSFGKYAGLIQTGKDGLTYRVINDLDVVSEVDQEVR